MSIETAPETCKTYKCRIELLSTRWAKVVENNGDYVVD
jgi:hypothetical protein